MGILLIGEKLSGEIFSRRELDLLGVVTGQAATALENARLYEAVRQAYEELSHTQAQNARLEAAVAARARDLAEANDRLTILDRSKDEFLNLISHELRTPLNGLLGVGELPGRDPSTEESSELQEMFEQSRRRLLSILDDALLLTQIDVNGEQFRSAPVPLHAALSRAIERTTEFAESRRVTLIPPSAAWTSSWETRICWYERFTRSSRPPSNSPRRGRLSGYTRRGARLPKGCHREPWQDNPQLGPGEILRALLESRKRAHRAGIWVGPPVAYRILSLFGASVSVANRDPVWNTADHIAQGCCAEPRRNALTQAAGTGHAWGGNGLEAGPRRCERPGARKGEPSCWTC